jgi:acyl-CoA thioesterase I
MILSFYKAILFPGFITGALICGSCNQTSGKNELKDTKATQTMPADTVQPKTILFFGNSRTSGYGLPRSQAFPALIQQKIDSLGLPYICINAGLSGETTAGGTHRINGLLNQQIDIFVLELGANDGLRGIPVRETSQNLQEIIDKVKLRHPKAKIVLAGMEIPAIFPGRYAAEFRVIFRELALKNNIAFVPFLLEGVVGNKELNLPDGFHPNAAGQKLLASHVWKVLEDLL